MPAVADDAGGGLHLDDDEGDRRLALQPEDLDGDGGHLAPSCDVR